MSTPQKKLTIEFDPPLKGPAARGTSTTEVTTTMTETALVPRPSGGELANVYMIDVQRVVAQTMAIQQVMAAVMKPGHHYGVIPGTEKKDRDGRDVSKPSLFQPGADKLCLMFRLRPEYEETTTESADFISIRIRCKLIHIVTGENWGEGMGSANSREARYLNQATAKVCPHCKKPAIIKGKEEFGGGWLCFVRKDGCGAKFPDDAPAIVGQVGQVNGDKIWDLHNTILKMACKRARVAAVLTATAASDIFTQDLEDLADAQGGLDGAQPPPRAATQAAASGATKPVAMAKPATAAVPAGPKRASPIQVRDLNLALNELQLGVADANAMDLRGRDRESALMAARLRWISQMAGREIVSIMDIGADEAASLIGAAKAGEMPTGPQDTGGGV